MFYVEKCKKNNIFASRAHYFLLALKDLHTGRVMNIYELIPSLVGVHINFFILNLCRFISKGTQH